MQDTSDPFEINLADLRPAQWLQEMKELGTTHGFFEPLGKHHNAVFVERGDTLLVTFESLPGMQVFSPEARPMGFDLAKENDWSCLTVVCNRDTWFRDGQVYGFFDQLTDDGFFEEFDQVIFFGGGAGGYAACAYSVASPGATVLALEPQATLDPRIAEWDDRFVEMRKLDFSHRYGFAPDMLEAAEKAYIIYDPQRRLDAMHAALFERNGITRFRARHLGGGMQSHMQLMGMLKPLVRAAADGTLNDETYAKLYRMRRDYVAYCKRLFGEIDEQDRPYMSEAVCAYISETFNAPRYRRKLAKLRAARSKDDDEVAQEA